MASLDSGFQLSPPPPYLPASRPEHSLENATFNKNADIKPSTIAELDSAAIINTTNGTPKLQKWQTSQDIATEVQITELRLQNQSNSPQEEAASNEQKKNLEETALGELSGDNLEIPPGESTCVAEPSVDRTSLAKILNLVCTRCGKAIPDSQLPYSCSMCNSTICICQDCFNTLRICRIHNVKLFKRAMKSYSALSMFTRYVEPQVTDDDTEIVRAMKLNKLDELRSLSKDEENLNTRDSEGLAPLHVASSLGLVGSARILLEERCLREIRDDNNLTPLITAVNNRHIKLVEILLESGANVNSANGRYSSTALQAASVNGDTNIVKLLLKHNATADANSGLALRLAISTQSVDCVRALLEGGVNTNCEGPLLVLAIESSTRDTSSHEIINTLLQNGVAIEQSDNDGYTPLLAAAVVGDVGICQSLLDRGANINAYTARGDNPLTAAAMSGHVEIVKLLLRSGASGRPPPVYSGKWKYLQFTSGISWPTRQEILSILRRSKHS